MNLIIKRYKILIISFSMFFLIFNCFKPQKIYAVVGVDDAIVIGGGVTITAGTVATVVGIGLTALGGYVVAENYDGSMLQKCVGDALVSSGQASKYIGTKVTESGQRVIQWTVYGIAWLKDTVQIMWNTPSFSADLSGTSGSLTVSSDNTLTPVIASINSGAASYKISVTSTNGGTISYTKDTTCSISGSSTLAVQIFTSYAYPAINGVATGYGVSILKSPYIVSWECTSSNDVCLDGSRYKAKDDSICPDDAGTRAQVPVNTIDGTPGVYDVPGAWDYGKLGGLDWGGVSDAYPDVLGVPLEGTTEGDTDTDTDIPSDTTGDITGEGGSWVLNIPILGDILRVLMKILELLKTFVKTLIDALVSAITTLFVPSDTYFTDKFDGYRTTLIGKLGDNNFDFLQQSGSNIEDIYINIFGQQICIVKITLFNKFKDFAFIVIRAFFYFFLILFNFNQVIKFLRGSIFSDYNSRESMAILQNNDNLDKIINNV